MESLGVYIICVLILQVQKHEFLDKIAYFLPCLMHWRYYYFSVESMILLGLCSVIETYMNFSWLVVYYLLITYYVLSIRILKAKVLIIKKLTVQWKVQKNGLLPNKVMRSIIVEWTEWSEHLAEQVLSLRDSGKASQGRWHFSWFWRINP